MQTARKDVCDLLVHEDFSPSVLQTLPEAGVSWKWADLWDDGLETAACAGGGYFIWQSVPLPVPELL